jgi:iron complex outermembrane receptor protein
MRSGGWIRRRKNWVLALSLFAGPSLLPCYAADSAPLPPRIADALESEAATPVVALRQPTPPTPPATLPETNVVAEPNSAPTQQPPFNPQDNLNIPSVLEGSVFASPAVTGYNADSSTAGSIINVPGIRFPGIISTVTSDVRRDQQALRVDDILRDIGGAVKTGGDNLRPDQFFLRGLEMTSYNFRKNGFMDPTYSPRDFANVERVDILKGPASIAYGSAQPAGTFNITTKKALQDRFANSSMTYGSFGLQRYQVDANTMNQSGDVLYRFNGAFENRGSFRDTGFDERTFVAPTVSWLVDRDTIVTWEGEYLYDRQRADSGLIAVNGDSRAFPVNKYFGDPGDRRVYRDFRSTLSITHNINGYWSWYVGGTTLFYDAPGTITSPTAGFLGPAPGQFYTGGLLNREQNVASKFAEQNHAIIANLSGEFDTGPWKHHLVVGTENDWFVVNHDQFLTSIPGVDPALTIDPFAPGPFPTTGATTAFTFDNPGFRQNRHGIYFQDLVELSEKWKLMFGARYDHLDQTYTRALEFSGFPIFGPTRTIQHFDQGTPRVGLIYEAIPEELSYYASYTTSFNPAGGAIFGPALATIKPEFGRIFEGGMKMYLLENLSATVGGFYIERQNVATQLNNFAIIQADQQRSQGAELSLTGQWSDRLSTVSNWTYNDVTQSDATGTINGRVRGVPFNNGNVWTRYDLIKERNRTLGIGLGWVSVGKRRGDYTSPLVLNAYDRWDMGAYGTIGRWNLTSYIENIFNARYEVGSINQYQVFPGAPANFRIQASTTF